MLVKAAAEEGKMTTYSHPGVYIEELPGPQLITAASTSNTAFVGRTETGTPGEPVLITSWNAYQSTFGSFTWGTQTAFAVYAFFAQGGSIAYVTPAVAEGEQTAKVTMGTLIIAAASAGSWGNELAVQITNSPPTPSAATGTTNPIFALNVLYKIPQSGTTLTLNDQLIAQYAASNSIAPTTIGGERYYVLESYPGLSARDLTKPADSTSPAPIETRINGQSIFVRATVTPGSSASRPDNTETPEELSGGVGDTSSTPLNISEALQALDTVQDISLLLAPETAMIEDVGKQRDVAQQVLTYCENRPIHDLFAILDTPYGLNVQDAEAYKIGGAVGDAEAGVALHSSYGAIYYPWIEFLNPASSMNIVVPPSGAMAGTYANADQKVGPWQVPAGVTYGALNIATGVTRKITTADQDVLNPNGVNAIRPMINYGILAYGGRTLTSDPSLVYISVRRTLIEIEVSLYYGLQWVVFEPNTPKLWGSVNRDVTEFLTDLWQQGALVGTKASDAFWVQCDESNNPPDVQRKGQLYVDIGVAPTYPAEFVIIRIQQTTVSES